MSTLILRPNSDDTVEQTISSGSDAYAVIDEAVLDTGDYNYKTGSGFALNLYGFPNHTTESGIINSVSLYAYIQRELPDYVGYAKFAVKISGTVYYSPVIGVLPDNTLHSYIMSINPDTGLAWTWSEVDSLVAGIALGSVYTYKVMNYQLYAVISYSSGFTMFF